MSKGKRIRWGVPFSMQLSFQITACLSSYLELRPCRPRIERLKELLSECPFQGPSHEGEESQQGWGGKGDSAPLDDEGKGRKRRKRAPRKVRQEKHGMPLVSP